MTAFPDRYMKATEEAKNRVRNAVGNMERGEMALGPTLTSEQQQQMFEQRVKPLVMEGKTEKVLEWIARSAPPGTDPFKELKRMLNKFGGEK